MAKNKINIKPENKGKFTNWANSKGMSIIEAANRVMSNTKKYSPTIVKRANFAKNASKWNKKRDGGDIVSTMGYRDDSPFRNSKSLNIYSPEGYIDMTNVSRPIMANGQRLEPNSGLNQVPPNSSGYVKETPMMYKSGGGYTVTRSNNRKGKTHKVTRKSDGKTEYYGYPGMGEKENSKLGKKAFRSRHAKNLKNNPFFRAYANATWEYGGSVPNIPMYYQDSGTPIYRDTTDAPPNVYQKGGPMVSENPNKPVKVDKKKQELETALLKYMKKYNITSPYMQQSMMGIIMGEGGIKGRRENLNYSKERLPEVFSRFSKTGKRVPKGQGKYNYNKLAEEYEKNPEKLANFVYNSDSIPSNTEPGDGYKFRGAGSNQLTGRGAFRELGKKLGVDLENNPDMLNNNVDLQAHAAVRFVADRLQKTLPRLVKNNPTKYGDLSEFIDFNSIDNFEDAAYLLTRTNAGYGKIPSQEVFKNRYNNAKDYKFNIDFEDPEAYTARIEAEKEKLRRDAVLSYRSSEAVDPANLYVQEGPLTDNSVDQDRMDGVMKARLAYAQMHGNPAANRMVAPVDNPYDFGDGRKGTHYMSSIDNYAVPQIQNENGELILGNYGPESNEAIRFDSSEDADYFAKENYKNVSPSFYKYGGSIPNVYQKGGNIYNVKSGDTFLGIGNRHNITPKALTTANPGIDINKLSIGQNINIPNNAGYGMPQGIFNDYSKIPSNAPRINQTIKAAPVQTSLSSTVTPEFLEHLRLREGKKVNAQDQHYSYYDSEDRLTGGIGHLMTAKERAAYPKGTTIPKKLVSSWLLKDSKKAYNAALKQAKELGIDSQDFVNSLASVNYQLGTGWRDKFTKTWGYLKDKNYEKAIPEAADSKWYRQTPVRVKDFQKAIGNLYKYGGSTTIEKNYYKEGGSTDSNNSIPYANISGVNVAKLQEWYSLGKEAPSSVKEASILAEAVGYPPGQAKVVAAQWALESARGSKVGGTYNYFGIKSHSKAVRDQLNKKYGIVTTANTPKKTQEEVKGKRINIKSSFLNFKNPIEAFLGHKAFLETNKRYEKALTKTTPSEFAQGLKDAGYATSSIYVSSLGNVIKNILDPKEYVRFKNSSTSTQLVDSTETSVPLQNTEIVNKQKDNALEFKRKSNVDMLENFNVNNVINQSAIDINIPNDVALDQKNAYIDKLNTSMPGPKNIPRFGQAQLFK